MVIRPMIRVVALLLCVAVHVTPSVTHVAAPATSPEAEMLTKLPPEVRLRKLHLVRPDLIQYPISYEVYC